MITGIVTHAVRVSVANTVHVRNGPAVVCDRGGPGSWTEVVLVGVGLSILRVLVVGEASTTEVTDVGGSGTCSDVVLICSLEVG